MLANLGISIHALREEGDVINSDGCQTDDISIHALREEGDDKLPKLSSDWIKISIHALREEGDVPASSSLIAYTYFYPRPPRGGRPAVYNAMIAASQFLSTPSARRATRLSLKCREPALFLSTPSARRATLDEKTIEKVLHISIHALREEGDFDLVIGNTPFQLFLSTPSARRATPSRSRRTAG